MRDGAGGSCRADTYLTRAVKVCYTLCMDFEPHNAKKALDVAEAAAKCQRPVLEPKFDGWRMITFIDADGEPTLFSRTGHSYTRVTPEPILEELRQFPPNTILDGEMVDAIHNKNCTAVTNVFGKSRNKALQIEKDRINYIIFDCTELAGEEIADLSLEGRRFQVGGLLAPDMVGAVHMGGPTPTFERIALTPQAPAEQEYHELFVEVMGYEGSMVKDLDSTYCYGKRGYGWFKVKATVDIDVVVMGMELDGKGQHKGKVGRFRVGQYVDGELIERVSVNPYDDAMRDAFTAAVVVAEQGGTNEFIGRVCTIKHYGALKDRVRHPVFARWREDKPAEECVFDNGE